jgi:uncharacterized membrane protein
MTLLLLGMLLFIGAHSVSIFAPAWRDGMAARLGEKTWKGLYAAVSLVGFVLLVLGYSAARQAPVSLYVPPVWTRHLALLLMLPVFPLLVATYLPGRISRAARHPMLLAVKIWATAHLLANGMLADVVLFGVLLAWAVADRISLKRRPARPIPAAPPRPINDLVATGLGLLVYVAFVAALHRALFGVSPLS